MPQPAIPADLIDADAQKVIKRLVRNGYQAYLVGGCVRDLLLGRKPKDFDLATSATPSEVRDLFRNCRIIGRRFRLAHVFFGPKIIETATFRANPREVLGDEDEGEAPEELLIRHDNVFGTAEEDARRRDFTINGLFYDLEAGKVIDYVDGLVDLQRRSVRTIGDPDIRFREDPVRILRAIKFAARLGFDIDDRTYRGVISHREEISKSAPPRVLEEIYRLLRGGAALESVVLLMETGTLQVMIPELAATLQKEPALLDPYLSALDQMVTMGETPGNAALLCALCAPDLLPLISDGDERAPGRGGDVGEVLERVLGPLLDRVRVSRRDAERVRQVLLAQRRIGQMRKRGGRPGPMAQRDWYQEAVQVHALFRLASGAKLAAVQEEVRLLGAGVIPRGPGMGPPAPQTVSETLDEGGGRRRGRRRRRPEDPKEGPEAGAGSGADPALDPDADPGRTQAALDGDEEPIENEDAVLAAFNAALQDSRFDD